MSTLNALEGLPHLTETIAGVIIVARSYADIRQAKAHGAILDRMVRLHEAYIPQSRDAKRSDLGGQQ